MSIIKGVHQVLADFANEQFDTMVNELAKGNSLKTSHLL